MAAACVQMLTAQNSRYNFKQNSKTKSIWSIPDRGVAEFICLPFCFFCAWNGIVKIAVECLEV